MVVALTMLSGAAQGYAEQLPAAEARSVFDELLRSVVKMLCAGVVHGDLSEFKEPHLLYVAATRAKHSTCFVCDGEVVVPGVQRFQSADASL